MMMVTMMSMFMVFSFLVNSSPLLILLFAFLAMFAVLDSTYYSSFSTVMSDGSSALNDEYSAALSLMMMLVLFFSLLCYYQHTCDSSFRSQVLWVLICLMSLASALVFYSSSLLLVYIGYEMSLIPIILIIYGWGAYPERAYSALAMLLYTLFFSLPLLAVLSYLWAGPYSSFSLSAGPFVQYGYYLPVLSLSLLLFLAFAVKLPIYGVHSWLPLAHVEAPTFGSMILAGLLLKLGGAGLYRFVSCFPTLSSDLLSYGLAYLLISMVVVSVISCVQMDLKRLIAYSSVVHMTSVGVLFLLGDKLGYNAALILMVMHGISSPLMFYMVGEVYRSLHTRSLLILRSLKYYFPMLYFSMIVVFFLTVPVPPALTFLGEVFLFLSVLKYGSVAVLLASLYLFVAVVFNLVWLSSFFGSNWRSSFAPSNTSVVSLYLPMAMVVMGAFTGLLCNSLFT